MSSPSSNLPAKPRLVIIGSGWSGFYITQYISQSLYDVTVISPRRTSAYTPLLASAAVGLFNFYLAEEPIRSKSRQKIRYIKAAVTSVVFADASSPTKSGVCHCAPAFPEDPELHQSEFDVEYDILVVAPGCVPNTFNTPGVLEHALFMKNVSDAMAVRKLLFDVLEKASLPHISESRASELLHIVIVGGGPTGIELTAELDDLAKHELRETYPDVAGKIRISVYDVAPNILSTYDKKLYEYANQQLVDRNVRIETNSHIEKVDKDALYTKEKGRVPYGMLIWATGNKNVPLIEQLEVRKTEKGLRRILTDDHLRVYKNAVENSDEIFEHVFALGDAADIDGASLPTTAEVAVQKAKYLVAHLNRPFFPETSSNDKSHKPFQYSQKRLVTYIGQHDGVIAHKGEGEGWTGASAWFAWRSGSVLWTRSWRNRVGILVAWMMNTIFGKEIAKM